MKKICTMNACNLITRAHFNESWDRRVMRVFKSTQNSKALCWLKEENWICKDWRKSPLIAAAVATSIKGLFIFLQLPHLARNTRSLYTRPAWAKFCFISFTFSLSCRAWRIRNRVLLTLMPSNCQLICRHGRRRKSKKGKIEKVLRLYFPLLFYRTDKHFLLDPNTLAKGEFIPPESTFDWQRNGILLYWWRAGREAARAICCWPKREERITPNFSPSLILLKRGIKWCNRGMEMDSSGQRCG